MKRHTLPMVCLCFALASGCQSNPDASAPTSAAEASDTVATHDPAALPAELESLKIDLPYPDNGEIVLYWPDGGERDRREYRDGWLIQHEIFSQEGELVFTMYSEEIYDKLLITEVARFEILESDDNGDGYINEENHAYLRLNPAYRNLPNASNLASDIRSYLGDNSSEIIQMLDANTIRVTVPESAANNPVIFLAWIESLSIKPDRLHKNRE